MSLKFVSLHNHTNFSLYDGFGGVNDYADWMLENAGEDSGAFAITDHGSLNAAGYIAAAQKKYGDKVKFIFGNEAYYIPSIDTWKTLKAAEKEEKENTDETSLVIEDESESKSNKFFTPLHRRHHMVVLAYTQKGLENLFRLTTRSYREGFYRKPRIDFGMLKECSEGLMMSTACLAGLGAFVSLKNADKSLEEIMEEYDRELLPVLEIFGKDRAFLELQFNKIPEQQIVNKHLIEYSKRSGYKLIAASDAHFSRPELFRDREIYKLLGFQMLDKGDTDLSILDKSIDELDCQLYLKNGDQMFAEYEKEFKNHFDDAQLIKEAIERSYDIAHNAIEHIKPDATIKLPSAAVPKDRTAIEELSRLVRDELKKRGLHKKKEYIDRAVYELKIIKEKDSASYFLAMKKILDILRNQMLIGCGRGSGVASLINYLLGITLVDPIQKGLLFERFMSPFRNELADVDSDLANREDAVELLKKHFGEDNVLFISNWNVLKLKSLIKDISRLYNIPFQEVNDVTRVIEEEARDKIMEEVGNDQKFYEFTYDRALKYSPTLQEFIANYPKVGERINNLYKQIKSCFSGDSLILTDNGYKTIHEINKNDAIAFIDKDGRPDFNYDYSCHFNGIKEIYKIETENGKVLELTEDHEVLTQNGYKKVKDLTERDNLYEI
jgi:DNA polymerase-3 subunit alpha